MSPSTGSSCLFFGTLKAGFPLHEHGMAGLRKLCDCRTVERYPMIIAGPWFAPMLFNEPGIGHRLPGELYVVDAERLARLDRLESLPKPGNLRARSGSRVASTAPSGRPSPT
jgi:gamma-glutamylaminecyclotransferase